MTGLGNAIEYPGLTLELLTPVDIFGVYRRGEARASFRVRLRGIRVGTLNLTNGRWWLVSGPRGVPTYQMHLSEVGESLHPDILGALVERRLRERQEETT